MAPPTKKIVRTETTPQQLERIPERLRYVTLREFAKLCDYDNSHLVTLVDEGFLPPAIARGKYDLRQCVMGLVQYATQQIISQASYQSTNPLQAAKIRREEATANKMELQYQKAAGLLVEVAEVETLLTEAVLTARKKLEVMADRISSQVAGMSPDEAAQLIRKEVNAALHSLSNLDLNS